MIKIFSILIFLMMQFSVSFASPYAGKSCTEVYSYCADSGRRNVGGTMMYLSDIDSSAGNCWDTQKVYRCVDDNWTSSCNVSSLNNAGYSLAPSGDNWIVENHRSLYNNGNKYSSLQTTSVQTRQVDVFLKTYSNEYILDCPSSTYLDSLTPSASIDSFSNAARGADCAANPDWYTSNSSTTVNETYSGETFGVNLGFPIEKKSHWICTTSVSSSCSSSDIRDCTSLGVVGTDFNPDLPPVVPLGQHESGVEYFECELDTTTVCDSPIESCEDPFETISINHPVFGSESIGRQETSLCYSGATQVCDEAQGYDTCQWSYYECTEYDNDIVASENWHVDEAGNSRNYGQCKTFVDHYVCPNDVVVSCNDEMNSCGDAIVNNEVYDEGGTLIFWNEDFICYNGAIDEDCDDPDGDSFHGCVKVGATCAEYDNANHTNPDSTYGTCVRWVDDYACPSEATYTCDRDYEDCRSSVEITPGSSVVTPPYSSGNEIYFDGMEVEREDNYYCWTGDIDEVCSIEDDIDNSACDWTGYTCHVSDPEKDTPNVINGHDYGTCVSYTDNWVCNNNVEVVCDSEELDCGPPDLQDGTVSTVSPCAEEVRAVEVAYQQCIYDGGSASACRASNPAYVCTDSEGNSIETNVDNIWVDWTEKFICYTGDYIESCEDIERVGDPVNECQKTGFTCLADDPINMTPDPVYGTCVNWIDRYVCGHEQYTECDTDFEMCTSIEVEETVDNRDGVETFRREVEYCYTDEINQSQCVLDEDKCYIYEEESNCQFQIAQRDADYQACVDAGNSVAVCESGNPFPTCRTEVQCPIGQRLGINCQLDWNEHDVAMAICLQDEDKTVADCELEAPLPSCLPEETDYVDCPHSGFTCDAWDYNLTPTEAANNEFEGREYGYCVSWSDRYTCPQFQETDCTVDIDETECGELSYVDITNTQDGQATEYTTILECAEGSAPDCVTDPSCTLEDVGCSEFSNGLCVERRQVWSCTTSRDDCVAWENTCAEPPALDFGEENRSPNNIQNMLAQASVAKMISENTTVELGEIRIFEGTPKTCRKLQTSTVQAMIVSALAIYYWTQSPDLLELILYGGWLLALDYDCCKVDNSAQVNGAGLGAETCQNSGDGDCSAGYDQGILDMLICSEEETELAKSRGSDLVVGHFGSYCSLEGLLLCLEKSYGYCEFDNLFSRIVQEQGRQQIENALVQGNPESVSETVDFGYYTNTPGGGWNLTEVNGNKVAFWSWDAACKDFSLNLNPPDSNVSTNLPIVCPYSDEVHIASCEGDGCVRLPDSPYTNDYTSGNGSVSNTDYRVSITDPYVRNGFALNRLAYVTGQCGNSTLDLASQALFWDSNFIATDGTLNLTALPAIVNGGSILEEFVKVQIDWGDTSSTDMVLNAGGSMYEASKQYLGASGPSGYYLTIRFVAVSGQSYVTNLNVLVEDGAVTNPNPNDSAGVIYLTGDGGALNAESCQYKLTAYPDAGAGTKIGYDMSWITNAYSSGWSEFEYDIGDHVVIPYEYNGGVESLSTVLINIDGADYQLPKDTNGEEVELGGLSFIGSCNDTFFSCSYRVYKTLLIQLLPWGDSEEPVCRGFTVDEVEALDFTAMDLSEWIATIIPEAPEEDDIVQQSIISVQSKEDALLAGARPSEGVVKAVYYDELTAHPSETFTFQTIGKIEINADVEEVFNRVVINWGDQGTTNEDMAYSSVGGFKASHVYNRTSGTSGFTVKFAFFADSGRVYNSEVKILIGYGSNTNLVVGELGGGDIVLSDFAINSNSMSGLHSSNNGG